MRWCESCVLPDTRPGIEIYADGVCSACRTHHERRTETDWPARRRQFDGIVQRVQGLGATYDCVIPVSGGKDSTWQLVTCIDHGLRPLAVTWRTPARTELGARNLENLISIGVDHIDFQVNPKVEAVFLLRALERYGTTAIPMHLAIFSLPMTVAVRFDIPLVVWGENSAAEYVGVGEDRHGLRLDSEWIRKYGAVHGTTAADWESDELSHGDLTPYRPPSDEELGRAGVEAIFLGQFFGWDPAKTAAVAEAHGFRGREAGPKTGYYDYADIDDDFISIHHHLKWHKFGFTRTFDNLSLEIRNGRMTRERAIEVLAELGDQTPDSDIDRFCGYVGIRRERFDEIAEGFRNPAVWTRRDGVWVIEDFLIEDWQWR
jgi:N-acetyl sugar amidotransferase